MMDSASLTEAWIQHCEADDICGKRSEHERVTARPLVTDGCGSMLCTTGSFLTLYASGRECFWECQPGAGQPFSCTQFNDDTFVQHFYGIDTVLSAVVP